MRKIKISQSKAAHTAEAIDVDTHKDDPKKIGKQSGKKDDK